MIDLRSPQIPDGDIEVDLDLDHATITLLVAEDTVIDQWDLAWTGRGKVKQTYHHNPAGTGRRIRLTGQARHGEVRVHSGGIAQLSAMLHAGVSRRRPPRPRPGRHADPRRPGPQRLTPDHQRRCASAAANARRTR